MLRKENGIDTPYTPIKKLMKTFTTIYYFYSWQDPDFENEPGFTIFDKRDATHRTYINADLPEGRDNFTYAHELGHIVLGHHRRYDCNKLNDYQYYLLDREANVFAANILMPEHWIKLIAYRPFNAGNMGRLKSIFGVSWAAMINRLDELGIQSKHISYQQFRGNTAPNKSASSGFSAL